MKTITEFLGKHGLIIIFVLLLLSTCTGSMGKKQSEKRMLNEVKNLQTEMKKLKEEVQLTISIEGLNSEFRMIEATDRKIMDLNRKDKIKDELSVLNEKLKKLKEKQ